MGFFESRKLVLFLVVTALVFSGKAQAWSWSWSWGSDHPNFDSSSGSSWSSSGSKSDGSSWGFGWSSNGIDIDWGWGSSSVSSSTGSTHHNNKTPSNHSSSNTHHNHTAPSNHSSVSNSTSSSHHNHTDPITPRREIEVTVWKNGFDYQEWLSKHKPFYVNDVLVFKYNKDQKQKNKNNDVYLLRDLRSYEICNVNISKKLAARESSSGGGFKWLLRKTQPYYFASGDSNNCNNQNMKFSISPIPRPSTH